MFIVRNFILFDLDIFGAKYMHERMSELAHCYILQHPLIVISYLPELVPLRTSACSRRFAKCSSFHILITLHYFVTNELKYEYENAMLPEMLCKTPKLVNELIHVTPI